MTPAEFDALEWDDYEALKVTMQRELREMNDRIAGMRR